MSTVLILAPVIISSWPAIAAAASGAATALGFVAGKAVQELTRQNRQDDQVKQVELELADSEVLAQGLAAEKKIVLTKGAVQITVERDADGQCKICASGKGLSETQLRESAEQFTQKLTQCFIYDKVMRELKSKSFQVVNEEVMQDEGIRIHVRRWVD